MKSGGAPLTFPTLEGDVVAWKVAGEALGSKPKASHCVRVGASSLIDLTTKGHGLRVQRTEGAQVGGKEGRRTELVTWGGCFPNGTKDAGSQPGRARQETGMGETDQLGQSRCN